MQRGEWQLRCMESVYVRCMVRRWREQEGEVVNHSPSPPRSPLSRATSGSTSSSRRSFRRRGWRCTLCKRPTVSLGPACCVVKRCEPGDRSYKCRQRKRANARCLVVPSRVCSDFHRLSSCRTTYGKMGVCRVRLCRSATVGIAARNGTALLLRRRAEIEGPPVAPGTMVAAAHPVLVALLNWQTFTGAGNSGVPRLDVEEPWCYGHCLAQWFSDEGSQMP